MVVALGPGRFYGSGLPRPRFYAEAKLGGARVDPPRPVMDPLLSWAHEAHWSMGGLAFTRHRLQGRIEGSVSKLRRRLLRRSSPRKPPKKSLPLLDSDDDGSSDSQEDGEKVVKEEVTFDDDDDDDEESDADRRRGRRKRKLGDEFDRIAGAQAVGGIGRRTRSQRAEVEIGETSSAPSPSPTSTVSEKGKRKRKKVDAGVVRRTSPRKKHL